MSLCTRITPSILSFQGTKVPRPERVFLQGSIVHMHQDQSQEQRAPAGSMYKILGQVPLTSLRNCNAYLADFLPDCIIVMVKDSEQLTVHAGRFPPF